MKVDFESFHEQYGLSTITAEEINYTIGKSSVDKNLISDGYHTFGELYEHRITLFVLLCRILKGRDEKFPVWKSQLHHDETFYEGWFIMGIYYEQGNQISYHLPISKWEETAFAEVLTTAPEFDGHTSQDVLTRLKSL